MRTTNFRRRLLIGVGTLLSGALLTLPTTGTAFASDCDGDSCEIPDYPPGETTWLDQYEWEQENTYAESDGSLYPESDNGVMAGPDGQGDWRGPTWPR
jgi:hypothetical protein